MGRIIFLVMLNFMCYEIAGAKDGFVCTVEKGGEEEEEQSR